MRYVIAESFDASEINHYFEADIAPRIGETLRSKNGRLYRIKDVACYPDPFDHQPNVRVLLKRER
jgi:hypothetical protein